MKRNLGFLAVLAMSSFAAVLASAQSAPPPMSGKQSYPQDQSYPQADQQQTGPAQGVARISLLRGDVSTQRGDSGDWVAVTLNTPVMAGDKVSTSSNGSAELELDSANMLRLSGNTEADITTLLENRIQVQLAQGLTEFSILRGSQTDVELDTPNVGIHPSRDASIRVQVISDNETLVTVRRGDAEISTSQGSTRVAAGQMITVRGTTDDAQYQTANAPGLDEWDKWNADRDRNIQSSPAWNHVDQTYTGANDLDRNGEWSEVPDYGQVWTPNNVDDNWAPYSDGNWVWEPYYGWTWVGYEPWGWAPYHYGRWFRYGGAWRWWPGERGIRPIWSPAYVSFFGFDGDFGIDAGFGSIGWLPIGPCDPFFPWWGGFGFRVGFFGFRDFDRFDFRDRDGFHRRFPGAFEPLRRGRFDERFSNFRQAERDPHILRSVNSVRANDFGRGGVSHTRGISSEQFHNSHFTSGSVPAVPTHASLSATNRSPNPGTIRNNQNTRFFGNGGSRQPVQHNSFNQQVGRMQQSFHGNGGINGGVNNAPESNVRRYGSQPGRPAPGNNGPGNTIRPNNNDVRPNRGTPPSTQSSRPGGRSFEAQGTDRPSTPVAPTNGGWQRFNGPAGPPSPRQQGPQFEPGRITNPNNVDRPAIPSQPRYSGNSRPPMDLRRPVVGGNGQPYGRPGYNGAPPPNRPAYNGGYPPPNRPSYGNGYPPPSRPSYSPPPAPSRPSYGGSPAPGPRPSYGGGGGGRPAPPPPSRPSGGNSGGGSHGGSSGGSSHGNSGGSPGRHH